MSVKILFFSCRSASLVQGNTLLREQLDQSLQSNQKLTEDVRRLTNELQQVRDELQRKTKEWKEQERVNRCRFRFRFRFSSFVKLLGFQSIL